jgi:sugar-specific transcriptional regulator TrmB
MNNVNEQLQQLGFSEYEAKAYIALLQEHPLNGYALAKLSGIPRANIYGVLQKLEERGAVVAVNTAAGTVYSPIAPKDLIHRLGIHIREVLTAAHQELEALAAPVKQTYVQNLHGNDQLLENARDLIHTAHERLLIALWQPEAGALAEALAQAQARGVAINMLCCQACAQECGSCQGSIFRYRVTPDQQTHGLIVIQDDDEMLVGTMGTQATAIRTHQPGLVQMTAWYVRHSITLATILTDLSGTLEAALSPETRQLLTVIGQGDSWLESVRRLVEGGLTAH